MVLVLLLSVLPARQDFRADATGKSAHSLFAQSAVQVLSREFTGNHISYLLLDTQSGVLWTSRWDNQDKPIPLGSLVKPFTALAYAEAHDYSYPTYECEGQASGCWRMQPHGNLDIVSAISVSCNSYFRSLAQNVIDCCSFFP